MGRLLRRDTIALIELQLDIVTGKYPPSADDLAPNTDDGRRVESTPMRDDDGTYVVPATKIGQPKEG